jgi:hypothetical protein
VQNLSSRLPVFDPIVDPNAGERWRTSTYFGPSKWAISSLLAYFPGRC